MTRKSPVIAKRAISSAGRFESTATEDTVIETQEESRKEPRIQRTYHLPADVVDMVKDIQYQERKRTSVEPELSDIVAAAIRSYASEKLNNSNA